MIKVIEMGANVVGGMPYSEWIEEDSKNMLILCLNLLKNTI